MARYVGIDIGAAQVKVAVVRGTARRFVVERLAAVDRTRLEAGVPTSAPLEELLREVAREPAAGSDPLSIGFDGAFAHVRTVEVPAAVRRRIAEVLPFELEAQLPFDIDEAVFDYRPRPAPAGQPQPVLVTVARTDQVREQIELCKRAVGREPDHVVPGAFALAELASSISALRGPGVLAILDVGSMSSELVVLEGGEPRFARTVSRGVTGLPGTAAELSSELRRTALAYKASGGPSVEKIFLAGGGALVHDLGRWLSSELGVPVEPFPLASIDGLLPDKQPEGMRFVRAIGIALAGAPRRRGLDLRRGPLAFERGYGFLRDRAPLLIGLGATIVVAFGFAMWARARNVVADRKTLEAALLATTRDVLGESTAEVERVNDLLSGKGPLGDDDPLPRADAMDVLVQISELIPSGTIRHDIERLDMQRQPAGGFKVTLKAIAPTVQDVASIESNLKAFRCFQNPTVTSKAKYIYEDRQKYTLEVELRCPEEAGGTKKPTTAGASAAGSK